MKTRAGTRSRIDKRSAGGWATALLVLLLLSVPEGAEAWTRRVYEEIAEKAMILMPPSLRYEIIKRRSFLLQGATSPSCSEDMANHFLFSNGAFGTADKKVVEELDLAVKMIQDRRPFGEVAFRLGVISHYLADISNPLHTSNRDPRMKEYYSDYMAFTERNLRKFPLVFDGYHIVARGRENLASSLRQSADRMNRFYVHIGKTYHPNGGRIVSSRTFDERSLPFGIASLAFSHAVSDVSNVWLLIWKEANGDLNDTPYISTAGLAFKKYDRAFRRSEDKRYEKDQ